MMRPVAILCGPAPFACVIAVAAALFATAVRAEPMANLAPGNFVKIIRDYDADTDQFINAPPKGEADACFQITAITDQGVQMVLVAGLYHPWWSDAPILPGATDTWSNSPGYLENRPDAAPLDLIRQIFLGVDGCPAA